MDPRFRGDDNRWMGGDTDCELGEKSGFADAGLAGDEIDATGCDAGT